MYEAHSFGGIAVGAGKVKSLNRKDREVRKEMRERTMSRIEAHEISRGVFERELECAE